MAKAIATITGVALAPGVSRNKRLYTAETIGKMVSRANERITAGSRPIAMYTSHGTSKVTDIGGVVTKMWQEDDGAAHYIAEIPDTPTGRAVAALVDPSGGKQFLRGVSVYGNWVGGEYHQRGPDGGLYETGSDFEVGRLDLTSSPGVDKAGVHDLKTAAADGESGSEYAVSESAPEALVTAITEETGTQPVAESTSEAEIAPQVPEGVREALAVLLGAPVTEADNATPAISKRGSGMSGGGRKWADPGYQADKKQRYDITTKAKATTAWRYINQASKAAKYSSAQLKNIKSRIRSALKGFGVQAAAEGWVIEPAYQVTEAVAEFYGDPDRCGSWCITASNGPVSLNLSSYGMDPADMDVILRAAAAAACDALKALDPDMDGDIDVDGVGDGSDTDHDGGHESAPDDDTPATETAPAAEAPGENPAPAGTQERGDPAMAEETTTTEAGGGAPAGLTLESVQKAATEAATAAVTAALEARDKAKQDKKAEKAAATESATPAAGTEGGTVAETQDAREKRLIAEALEAAGVKPPVQESQDEREARLIAAALKAAGVQSAVAETEEQRVDRLVQEGVQSVLQAAVANGAILPGRSGVVVREHATDPDDAKDSKALAALSDDDFQSYAGSNLDKYVGDHTRIQALHT